MAKLTLHPVTTAEQTTLELVTAEADYWRPRTRADCKDVPRPCPYVGCRYHLYLVLTKQGGGREQLRVQRRDGKPIEPWELEESCALDVADRVESLHLVEVGEFFGFTRERARQIESLAKRKFLRHPGAENLAELIFSED